MSLPEDSVYPRLEVYHYIEQITVTDPQEP